MANSWPIERSARAIMPQAICADAAHRQLLEQASDRACIVSFGLLRCALEESRKCHKLP